MMTDRRVLSTAIALLSLFLGPAVARAEWVRIGELERTTDGPDFQDVTVDRTIPRLRIIGVSGMLYNGAIELWSDSGKSSIEGLGVITAGKSYERALPGGAKQIKRLRIRTSGGGRYAVEVDALPGPSAMAPARPSASPAPPLTALSRDAAAGSAQAQYALGCAYYLGTGVATNYAQAFAWYLKAATQGHRTAQEALANLYYRGQGVPRDYNQSVSWSRKAAEQGSVVAYYNLAVACEDGTGAARDPAEAARWYRKAADQGDQESAAWLKAHPQLAGAVTRPTAPRPPPARVPNRPPASPPVLPPAQTTDGARPTKANPVVALPTELPASLDLERLTAGQYAGAVSAAMEGMRLVHGDMTQADKKAFEARWAPCFAYPMPAVIDWCNSFNPLLSQFLALGSAIDKASLAFDAAQEEIIGGVLASNTEALSAALQTTEFEQIQLNSLKSALDQVVRNIHELGEPPNAAAAMDSARKQHRHAFQTVKKLNSSPAATETNGCWVLTSVDSWAVDNFAKDRIRVRADVIARLNSSEEEEHDVARMLTDEAKESGIWDWTSFVAPPSNNACMTGAQPNPNAYPVTREPGQFLHTWSPPPAKLFPDGTCDMTQESKVLVGGTFGSCANISFYFAENPKNYWGYNATRSNTLGMASVDYKQSVTENGVATDDDRIFNLGYFKDKPAGTRVQCVRRYNMPGPEREGSPQDAHSYWQWFYVSNLDRLHLYCDMLVLAGPPENIFGQIAVASYCYSWSPTGELPDSVLVSQGAPVDEEPAADDPREEGDARAKDIEFYLNEVSYWEIEMGKRQAEMAAASSETQEALRRRVLDAEKCAQQARDEISRLQTGVLTVTPTEIDRLNGSMMAIQSAELAGKINAMTRMIQNAPRLIALAPEGERRDLQQYLYGQFDAKTLASLDIEKMTRAVRAVGDKVLGASLQESGRQEEIAAVAEQRSDRAEAIKMIASAAVMMIPGAGTMLGVTYFAGTGYAEGGVEMAIQTGASAYNMPVFMANSAMEGYHKAVLDHLEQQAQNPGRRELDETGVGLAGAGASLARDAIFGLALHVSARRSAGAKPGAPEKPISLAELKAEKAFLKRRTAGEASADRLESALQKQAAFERQLRAAERGPEQLAKQELDQLAQLQKETHAAYAAVKNDQHAKLAIQLRSDDGKLGADVIESLSRIEDEAMKRILKRVSDGLARDGWKGQPLELFRNSCNQGRIGMDLDLGIRHAESITRRMPDGSMLKRPIYEYQDAGQRQLEKAWEAEFGKVTRESYLDFTTTAHPEAYRNLAWLGGKDKKIADLTILDRRDVETWAQQTASISGFKVNDLLRRHPNQDYFSRLQEQCRGLTKDFNTKLMPLMGRCKNPKAAKHMEDLHAVMGQFARNEIGPIEANRKIKMLTGGEGIAGVAERFRTMLEGLDKLKPAVR